MDWIDTRTWVENNWRRMVVSGTAGETRDPSPAAQLSTKGSPKAERVWAEAIRHVRGDPQRRLAVATRRLPLPAAFREAALGLRAIIRKRRRQRAPFEAELAQLHHLAAISALAAHDALDAVPFAFVERLDLTPMRIGWNELPLLKIGDRKLMYEIWGRPRRHAVVNALYPGLHEKARAHARNFGVKNSNLHFGERANGC